ncbi:hypothetical protein L0U85_14480 [Glycomyces sp. L485]|uniref:hypothetical protein n=1 Tax=Glycomyces sp. L485 TaxID=2909235 RepID=UPI001F4A7FAF|nr:hypothetical protein [Glycomyces sp. L485]MCH7232053.1 hypothetical protein [Glycomyces sp. L485]
MDEQPLPQSRPQAPLLTWEPVDEIDRVLGEEVVRRLRSAASAIADALPTLDEYDCHEIVVHLDRSLKDVVDESSYEHFLHLFGHLFTLRDTPEPHRVARTITALADAVEVGLWEL